MNNQKIKNELQTILSGKSNSSYDPVIQTVASYLKTSQRTSPLAEDKHQNKAKETEDLVDFAFRNNLIVEGISESDFIAQGAEQKVYIKDKDYVIKLNDTIYYASWEDYFYNLLLHNYFFSDTAYQLLGFYKTDSKFYAVVKQRFIQANQLTRLMDIKNFLDYNGFENLRNQDYYHPQLGIILEDLHDENVLTQNDILYFIDTVFFLNPHVFWKE